MGLPVGVQTVRVTRDMPARRMKAGDVVRFPAAMVRVLKARGYVEEMAAVARAAEAVGALLSSAEPAADSAPIQVETRRERERRRR